MGKMKPVEKYKSSSLQAVRAIYTNLSGQLIEREEMLKGCLIAMLARKHVFLIGPPGVAKSLAIEKICGTLTDARYFEWLMDMHTKPEHLFGPPMLSMLKQDKYLRNTESMMPEAHIAFLDEIWKSSGAILNTLLRLMDESRKFYNGANRDETELISVFGASNELPEDPSLQALYDRFMLRYSISDIVDDRNFHKMLSMGPIKLAARVSLEVLLQAQEEVDCVDSKSILDVLVSLRVKFRQTGMIFSPRRWRESVRILQAHAWFCGRDTVATDDLEILSAIFWNKPEEKKQVQRIIMELISPHLTAALALLDQATEIHTNAMRAGTSDAGIEANSKFKRLKAELKTITDRAIEGKQDFRLQDIADKITAMNNEIAHSCLGLD